MRAGSGMTTMSTTCALPVGQVLTAVDCSTAPVLPDTVTGRTGGTTDSPLTVVVPIIDGKCRLSADTNGQVTRILPNAEGPADVVGVVDFSLSSTSGVAGGLSLRCTPTQCITSELYSPGSFYMLEAKDATSTPSEIFARPFVFAAGRLYRMVVASIGNHVRAWIDGTLAGAGSAFVSSAGFVSVFVYDFSAGAGAYMDVQRFYAFLPAAT